MREKLRGDKNAFFKQTVAQIKKCQKTDPPQIKKRWGLSSASFLSEQPFVHKLRFVVTQRFEHMYVSLLRSISLLQNLKS